MKPCKDCAAEVDKSLSGTRSGDLLARRRPAPHPGPRCATHHREVTKARKAVARNLRIHQAYGITDTDYAAIYEAQGGRCYICRRATGKTKHLAVDHNHETGEVRGLLCGPCNRGVIGHLRDDIDALHRAIVYLREQPAQAVLLALNSPEIDSAPTETEVK